MLLRQIRHIQRLRAPEEYVGPLAAFPWEPHGEVHMVNSLLQHHPKVRVGVREVSWMRDDDGRTAPPAPVDKLEVLLLGGAKVVQGLI